MNLFQKRKELCSHCISFLLSIVAVVVIYSCSSPLDVDTERHKILLHTNQHILARLDSINIEQNMQKLDIDINLAKMEIDTLSQIPAVWLNIQLSTNFLSSVPKQALNIKNINIYLDSISVFAKPIVFIGNATDKAYSKFLVNRNSGLTNDTILFTDGKRNYSEILISIDKENKFIWANFWSKIYDYKLVEVIINGNKEWQKMSDSIEVTGKFGFSY